MRAYCNFQSNTAMINILYFASLREQLNKTDEQIELPTKVRTVGDLRQELSQRGDIWAQLLDPEALVMMAVNQSISDSKTEIADGDEIAFFPPVTGG